MAVKSHSTILRRLRRQISLHYDTIPQAMQATQSKNATEKSSKRCDIYVLASGSTRKGRYGIDQKKQG